MEYHETVAGRVYLESMGIGRWGVFTKAGNVFLGTVQLVTEDGKYEAVAEGCKARECASMDAAIKAVGAGG